MAFDMEDLLNMILEKGSTIALVACSNGQSRANDTKINSLIEYLEENSYKVKCSDFLYEKDSYFSGTGVERAMALMDAYKDENVSGIFDISGGDIANEVLDYLDYEIIKNSKKPFFGYSDLTTVINAIYTMTGENAYLYQIKNLIYDETGNQKRDFIETFSEEKDNLADISYYFIQETYMEGEIIGGNIRCFLKLAGTKYMPDFEGKILLLEALNSSSAQVMTYLCQLKQLGAFEKINGILLGTFTKLDSEIFVPSVEELIQKVAGNDIPVARTMDIGHGSDAKLIEIGKHMKFQKL